GSLADIQAILQDRADFEEHFRHEFETVPTTARDSAALNSALSEVRSSWQPNADVGRLKAALGKLYERGRHVRNGIGSLQPPDDLPLSNFSHLQPTRSSGGAALPAENTAYLGRTLFSDYLVAVELGGTLLLVATIGAIAIAGRRPEAQS